MGNSSMTMRKKRTMTAKGPRKTPERNTKHKITKMGRMPPTTSIPSTHMVNLADIGSINPPEVQTQPSPSKSKSTERINKMIEKRHLHKPYKTSATIQENDEFCYSTLSKKVNLGDSSQATSTVPTDNSYNDVHNNTQKLTSEALKTNQMGTKRIGLGSSLINFAMQDVTRVNKVKSEYNQNINSGVANVGSMMNAMSISNTLSGMLMMNNGLGSHVMGTQPDDDACSLMSGNTMQTFQNAPNPLFSLNNRFNYQ